MTRTQKPLTQIANDLEIADSTQHHWCKQFEEQGEQSFVGSGHQLPHEEELRQLKRENGLLRQERDILKKRVAHLLTRSALKFAFIEEHSQQYAIALLRQALDVSQSGYYAWKPRETSTHCREDAQLAADIQAIFVEHREVYGSPRILVVLKERGWKTSRKRVARLMRQLGLSAQNQRSRKPTTKSDPRARFAAN